MRRLGLAESRTAGATRVTHIHFFGTNITVGSAGHREILVRFHIPEVIKDRRRRSKFCVLRLVKHSTLRLLLDQKIY